MLSCIFAIRIPAIWRPEIHGSPEESSDLCKYHIVNEDVKTHGLDRYDFNCDCMICQLKFVFHEQVFLGDVSQELEHMNLDTYPVLSGK